MRKYWISVGASRNAPVWTRKDISWEELINKLKTPQVGTETQDEYLKLTKDQQAAKKDVGGFVGGTFSGSKRTKETSELRSLITLDLDDIPSWKTEEVLTKIQLLLGCAAAVYSTRKHKPAAPRLRVIIPLDRDATPDEYEPAARKAAQLLGIDMCDPASFRVNQLMFWPSVSSDGEYVFRVFEGSECSLDGLLGMYDNWRNVWEWPVPAKEEYDIHRKAKKMGDPLTKPGVVGDFCRAYNITEAIEKFLSDVYIPTDDPRRYTYAHGSSSGGAWIVDESYNIMTSFHATDPCDTVNSFDMVRIHLFGALDDGSDVKDGTPINRYPSFKRMTDIAYSDEKVRRVKAVNEEEKNKLLPAIFGVGKPESDEASSNAPLDAYEADWRTNLELDGRGVPTPTIDNASWFLSGDYGVKDRIWWNSFEERLMVTLPVPWSIEKSGERQWSNDDDKGLRWYAERRLCKNLPSRNLDDALSLIAKKNAKDPVLDYLNSLTWDGVPRLDRLFVDLFGAEDSLYTREVTRKFFTAAVARQFEPGTKFDCMLIIGGEQGIGKSTVARYLAGTNWYTDSLEKFEGKDAADLLRGKVIVEIGELNAMSRQEITSVKQFLSKEYDEYRGAYEKRVENHMRRCVFYGTTNDTEYLKDITGNRRFWPIDCGKKSYSKKDLMRVKESRDQIWAEAVARYRCGETLFLEGESAEVAKVAQKAHARTTGKEGILEEFLNKEIPKDWWRMEDFQRRAFMNGNFTCEETVLRTKACPIEIWMYCFGGTAATSFGEKERQDVIRTMANIEGWTSTSGTFRFGTFGKIRGFLRAE